MLAGSAHKPRLGHILAGWQAVRNREEIRRIVQGGDDNLLRGVVGFFEASGFPVLGVRDVAPGLMAGRAVYTRSRPAENDDADIERGFAAIDALGPLDVGQAVAVSELHVLAVEAVEGTDAMLRGLRCCAAGRHRSASASRPPADRRALRRRARQGAEAGQDFRVDLPAIGARTVQRAAAAGLAGIAVEAAACSSSSGQAMIARGRPGSASSSSGSSGERAGRFDIAIVVGEQSGDQLGFKLMRALASPAAKARSFAASAVPP